MQQEESYYDDDDYSDDFASHLGLSSINEDVELCQTTPSSHLLPQLSVTQPQQYNYTVEEESKDEDDDDNDGSYSVDDFTYISSSTATRHSHNGNDDTKDEEYSVDKHFVSGNASLVQASSSCSCGDESKDNEDTTDGDAPTIGEESKEMMGSKHDDVDVVISSPATNNNVEELGPTTPPTHNQTTSSSSEPLDAETSEVDTTFTSTTAVVHSDGVDDNSTTCQLQENTPCRQPQMGNAQTQTEPKSKCKSPQHQTKVIKKPADFVPRCAYAQTKAMKLRKMKEADEMQEKGQSSSNTNYTTKKYSKKRLEQLSKPNKHHLYNDKENIKPPSNLLGKKTKSKKSVGNDNADDDDAGSVDYGDDHNDAFLERMDSMEQERRERAELAKQETLYDVRTDKHKCKNCGGTQSYDDMIQGNAYCQNDRCRSGKHKYQPPRQFKVNEFEARQRRCSQRRSLVMRRIKEERRSSIFETSQRKSRLQMELSNKVSKARGGK